MASKIQGRDFDAPITPYVFNGDDYNTLRVHVDFNTGGYWQGGAFQVTLTPEKIERKDGYATRGFRITGTRDPLGSWVVITIEQAPRNSQKRIDKMYQNLTAPTRKEQIAQLFDQRRWELLEDYVKEVALTGAFSGTITNGEATAAETKEQGNQQESSTPKTETTMKAINIETATAQEFVGKTIIVGEHIATITIKSADGNTMQGEFLKEGTTPMNIPVNIDTLRLQVKSGAWRIEGMEPIADVEDVEEVEDIDLEGEDGANTRRTEPETEETQTEGEETETEEEETEAEETMSEETEAGNTDGDAKEDDPVLKQYKASKGKNPDATILFRNGDFYVVLCEDAKVVSKEIGRPVLTQDGIEMCIFPHTDLSEVMPKLVRAGLRIAIEDLPQGEKKAEAPKAKAKPAAQPKTARPKVQSRKAKVEEPEADAQEEVSVEENVEPMNEPAADDPSATTEPRTNEPLHIEQYTERACVLLGTTTHTQRVKLKALANYQTLKQGELSGQSGWVFPTKRRAKVEKALDLGVETAEHTEAVAQDNGVPHVIEYSSKGIIVAGDTSLIEPVLDSLGGQRRAFLRGGKAYNGIVLHARHKETVKRILDLAYTA